MGPIGPVPPTVSSPTLSGPTPTGQGALGRLGKSFAGITGWRRGAVAVALGILAAGALPPLHLVVLLVPAFCGLVWLMDGCARWRAAFAAGAWFGFGLGAAGLYWIANALLQEPEKFGWLVPVAVIGMAALMAVFSAAAVALAHRAAPPGVGRILVLAAAWTAMEWLRGWVLTGFPWNLLGTVWVFSDAMLQLASVTGVLGLSLLSVGVAAMPALLAGAPVSGHAADRAPGWRRAPVIGAAVVLGVVWVAGAARLPAGAMPLVPEVRLRLVQPNIPQRLKWVPELRQGHLAKQIEMTAAAGTAPPTHVIWAETAVPFLLTDDPARLAAIGRVVPRGGLVITGAPRATPRGERPFRVWNSIHAIDSSGRITATYDKFHLVPFGEYMPFRRFIDMAKITAGGTDFSPGPGPRTLRLQGLPPVSPLICYEVIFQGRVLDPADRPRWLLNLTNDAWYGQSPGPYQHLAAARLRAVEEGLPLVRVANTGISAVIDPYGRLTARLELGRQGVIDSGLPEPLENQTIYARLGDGLALFLVLAVAGWGIVAGRRRGNGAAGDKK